MTGRYNRRHLPNEDARRPWRSHHHHPGGLRVRVLRVVVPGDPARFHGVVRPADTRDSPGPDAARTAGPLPGAPWGAARHGTIPFGESCASRGVAHGCASGRSRPDIAGCPSDRQLHLHGVRPRHRDGGPAHAVSVRAGSRCRARRDRQRPGPHSAALGPRRNTAVAHDISIRVADGFTRSLCRAPCRRRRASPRPRRHRERRIPSGPGTSCS